MKTCKITFQKINLFSIIDQLFAKLLSHANYQQATIEITDRRCFNKVLVKSSTEQQLKTSKQVAPNPRLTSVHLKVYVKGFQEQKIDSNFVSIFKLFVVLSRLEKQKFTHVRDSNSRTQTEINHSPR